MTRLSCVRDFGAICLWGGGLTLDFHQFRLSLAPVLHFIEGLSYRGAADAVRGRIDWKYLLCLELDDPGFDHSILCEFRARLLEGGAERLLFDKILSALRVLLQKIYGWANAREIVFCREV